MTRAVVVSVDVPRTTEGGDIPAVALLRFDGSVQLAEPMDGSLESLTDLLAAAGDSGAHVLVDLPLSGTQGPVDQALQRAGLPPRFWKEPLLDRGRVVAEGIREAVDGVNLYESNPWAVLRVLWALRAKRKLSKFFEPTEKPLLDATIEQVELPALQNPYIPPSSGTGLKRVAKVIEDALSMIGLSVALEAAAVAADAEASVTVTARCRSLLGLLVGSLLRRRSDKVVTLTDVDPHLVLLADPYIRECLEGPGK